MRTLHAEQNAIIQCALHGVSSEAATAYVTHQPCLTCAKMLINAGVQRVVYAGTYLDTNSRLFLAEASVVLEHLPRLQVPAIDPISAASRLLPASSAPAPAATAAPAAASSVHTRDGDTRRPAR